MGPAAIIGSIGAPSGMPGNLISVQAYDTNQKIAGETQVRMDGTFELTGLPPGSYTVKFLGGTSGTADQWYSSWGVGGPATTLTVAAGRIADVIRVVMVVPPSFTDTSTCNEIPWLFSTEKSPQCVGIPGFQDVSWVPAVRRDAMAAFLYRLAGSPAVPADAPTFSDVPPGSPFYNEIRWLASTGVTRGFPDGTFHPAENVNPDAMAAFLYRYTGTAINPAIAATAFPVP